MFCTRTDAAAACGSPLNSTAQGKARWGREARGQVPAGKHDQSSL